MSKQDQYRANATLCQRHADESDNDDEKRQWLHMAQSWIGLIQINESVDAFRAERCARVIG
jgi:hypothetical protein